MVNGLLDERGWDPERFSDDGPVRGDGVLLEALTLPAAERPW
jgi:hypothetical protein